MCVLGVQGEGGGVCVWEREREGGSCIRSGFEHKEAPNII